MVNKLRRLAIAIIEDVEEHIDNCENSEDEPKKPFDEENWYHIEDKVYDLLYNHFVGKEETENDVSKL